MATRITPLSVLKAIGEDKSYRFNDGVLLHLRGPDVTGFDMGGWGIPQAMFCYAASRYVFGLRKMNEVLASDYLIPMRILSPAEPQDNHAGVIEGGTLDMLNWNCRVS